MTEQVRLARLQLDSHALNDACASPHVVFDLSCTGAFLGGMVLDARSERYRAPASGKSVTVSYLSLLIRDERGDPTTRRLIVPTAHDVRRFAIGRVYVFPVQVIAADGATSYVLRPNVPVLTP